MKHEPGAGLLATGKYPRQSRLRRSKDFSRVHRHGVRVQTRNFTVIALTSPTRRTLRILRTGAAVSRKVGGAVIRNRVKRLLRELFRRLDPVLEPMDLVVVAKRGTAELARSGFESVCAELNPAIGALARRVASQKKSS